MVSIKLIAAVALNGVIGREGDMPWRLPSDLRRFKAATLGKPVIMGRKTLDAIGKPLPGRENIIVTRQRGLAFDGVHMVNSFSDAISHARERAMALGCDAVMIAGGGEIYRQAMEFADALVITRVMAEPEGDALFPPIDETNWRLVEDYRLETGPSDTSELRHELYLRQ